jgi:hypothetical protein
LARHHWQEKLQVSKQRKQRIKIETQRALLDSIAARLNITSPEGWYKVTAADLSNNGARWVSFLYKDSVYKALKAIYPEYPPDFIIQ